MISKSIGILYGARLIIPRKQFNKLYLLFVLIYLNYVSLAWDSLYRQQKNSIRLLRGCSYRSELAQLGGLAHLSQETPFKNLACSYEK